MKPTIVTSLIIVLANQSLAGRIGVNDINNRKLKSSKFARGFNRFRSARKIKKTKVPVNSPPQSVVPPVSPPITEVPASTDEKVTEAPSPKPQQPSREVPSSKPTSSRPITYEPGNYDYPNPYLFDKNDKRVKVSKGLKGKAVAYTADYVETTSGNSTLRFHENPDGGAIYPASHGGFYYTSNSEAKPSKTFAKGWPHGGVYTLEFNSDGDVINYFPILQNTVDNCGGGKTPWGTWVTCEEDIDEEHFITNQTAGLVWQTDPSGRLMPQLTNVIPSGGNYESFAYDDVTYDKPHFFTTHDRISGPTVRFIPDEAGMECYNMTKAEERWCTLNSGSHDFLLFHFADDADTTGTFSFTADYDKASRNAKTHYRAAEGMECLEGTCYMTTKSKRYLFTMSMANMTFVRTSTVSGAFNDQPDQIRLIANDDNDIVYFCEDGSSDCGVHGRDRNGKFFSIIDGIDYFKSETTGLDFSPDGMMMIVSFQRDPGIIWAFWREDGYPFTGAVLDIKYHSHDKETD